MNRTHPLDEASKKVIEEKGTERPFSGSLDHCFDAGVYICKKCDYPLYLSSDKFNSGCGWASICDQITNHLHKKKDQDGFREEILCGRCLGHLGHVFFNEHLTSKNTRHCVNSLSLNFIPAFTKEGLERATLACGCFWGTEYFFKKLKGVKTVTSGYIGGHVVSPSYEEVCSHLTGHLEACEVLFDPEIIPYSKILQYFFEIHDFTQTNGQGPDIGPQYKSAIFVYSQKQKQQAEAVIEVLRKKGYKVATTIEIATKFYPAEDYHQDYYFKHNKTPYCHAWRSIF